MRETTDTNNNFDNKEIPDGTYDFQVSNVRKKGTFYVWTLEYGDESGEQVLFGNRMGPLLKILGCTETSKGIFEWDTDLMEGKTFKATVYHEADKKTGKIYQQMKDFQKSEATDDVPFGN